MKKSILILFVCLFSLIAQGAEASKREKPPQKERTFLDKIGDIVNPPESELKAKLAQEQKIKLALQRKLLEFQKQIEELKKNQDLLIRKAQKQREEEVREAFQGVVRQAKSDAQISKECMEEALAVKQKAVKEKEVALQRMKEMQEKFKTVQAMTEKIDELVKKVESLEKDIREKEAKILLLQSSEKEEPEDYSLTLNTPSGTPGEEGLSLRRVTKLLPFIGGASLEKFPILCLDLIMQALEKKDKTLARIHFDESGYDGWLYLLDFKITHCGTLKEEDALEALKKIPLDGVKFSYFDRELLGPKTVKVKKGKDEVQMSKECIQYTLSNKFVPSGEEAIQVRGLEVIITAARNKREHQDEEIIGLPN